MRFFGGVDEIRGDFGKCDYLAFLLQLERSAWIPFAPPFLTPFLRFYDAPDPEAEGVEESLKKALFLDRGNATVETNPSLDAFRPSKQCSYFCFVSDETFCDLQQRLQRNEFPKIVAILKPLVTSIYQKSVEFLEDAKWKEFVELEYWMLFLSISWCYLELYKYGFYYLTKVGTFFDTMELYGSVLN